ncbi:hypothetical protein M3J07_004684 [Ascochyta lentis]
MRSIPVSSSTGSSSNSPTEQRKIAIPRLAVVAQEQSATKHPRRVPRACTACRLQKIKCSGARPGCESCAKTGRECVYTLSRQDRLKTLTERCQQMAGLLNKMRPCATVEDNVKISHVLEAFKEDTSMFRQASASLHSRDTGINGCQRSLTAGAPEAHDKRAKEPLDFSHDYLHTDNRIGMMGTVGASSEIQWLRAVAMTQSEGMDRQSRSCSQERRSSPPDDENISLYTFWAIDNTTENDPPVDPYELPTLLTAERLLDCYMAKVHASFPILPRMSLKEQFYKCFTALQSGD